MLVNGQDDAEIASRADLMCVDVEAALAGARVEAQPLGQCDDTTVSAFVGHDLRGFVALTMGRYTPEARREFMDQVAAELAPLPLTLLIPAFAEARRKISFPERLVPFIIEFVEERADKLQAEIDRLCALRRILA